MRLIPPKRALAGLGGLLVVVAIAGTPAVAGPGDVECNGTAPMSVPHDLIVPENTSCIILFGSQIGHDVEVKRGGKLDDRGADIGHDLKADRPAGIAVNGGGMMGPGHIGHDVKIKGVYDGSFPSMRNSICNNFIGHDVVVEKSEVTAMPWSIGDRDGTCGAGAVRVAHDMTIKDNANMIVVADNTSAMDGDIGHDLKLEKNSGGLMAQNNHIGHDCKQKDNHPYSGSMNTADHKIDNCNSMNP